MTIPDPESPITPLGPDGLVVVPGPPEAFGLELAVTDPDRPPATVDESAPAALTRRRKHHGDTKSEG